MYEALRIWQVLSACHFLFLSQPQPDKTSARSQSLVSGWLPKYATQTPGTSVALVLQTVLSSKVQWQPSALPLAGLSQNSELEGPTDVSWLPAWCESKTKAAGTRASRGGRGVSQLPGQSAT